MRISKIISTALITLLIGCFGIASAQADQLRSVVVLSDVPQGLKLTSAYGVEKEFFPQWKQTQRGYEATITFPVSLAFERPALMLVRADGNGWSRWDQGNGAMKHLQYLNVGPDDPACVGGMRWCAVRGL